jgi:hypothetical protein
MARTAAKKEVDLDDEATQAEILDPPTREVTIGGETITLHKLSGHAVRKLTALAQLVFAGAAGPGSAVLRIGGILVGDYYDRFVPLLAEAYQPVGKSQPTQIAAIIAEIDKKTATARGAIELASAFEAMLEQNDVLEAFFPKNSVERPEAAK